MVQLPLLSVNKLEPDITSCLQCNVLNTLSEKLRWPGKASCFSYKAARKDETGEIF